MLRFSTALLVAAGLSACNTHSSSDGHVLTNAAVQAGAGVAVDGQHTLQGGAGSAAVVSFNPNGRLTAVIVD
ncbi:MAG: hypothetical protein H6706_19070 [Myxococcales bacterium]|nr:hypothetical protein [Myxococcales bacterium]